MYNQDYIISEILRVVEEDKKHGEFITRYDLKRILDDYEDEARSDGWQEGYSDCLERHDLDDDR